MEFVRSYAKSQEPRKATQTTLTNIAEPDAIAN